MEEDIRVAKAKVRIKIRAIDGKIAELKHETNFYRRMGFGRDYKDIQMMSLEEEKAKEEARLRTLSRQLGQPKSYRKNQPRASWFLLPMSYLLIAFNSIAPKRQSPRERFLQARWRPQPQVSFDLG